MRPTIDPMTRFARYFSPAGEGECWPWQGGKMGNGYGRFNWSAASNYAHRAAYMLFIGPIPNGMNVLHSCDNPGCVNPGHLRVGTQSENIRDMLARGRAAFQTNPEKYIAAGRILGASQRRAGHSRTSLSEKDVQTIKYLIERGAFHVDIAKVFSVSKDTIAGIARGRTWRDE